MWTLRLVYIYTILGFWSVWVRRNFYLYGPGPFGMGIVHSGRLPVCIFVLLHCVSYLLFLGRGFWRVVGRGLVVFSGWYP